MILPVIRHTKQGWCYGFSHTNEYGVKLTIIRGYCGFWDAMVGAFDCWLDAVQRDRG